MKSLICLFTISLFWTANAALHNTSWNRIHEEDGISVFAKKTTSGTIPFMAEGVINASLEKIVSVLKDHKKKHNWSPKLKKVVLHEDLGQENYVFSEYYKTPWPFADREFLLNGSIVKVDDDNVVLQASSIENDRLADQSHVQADVKKLMVKLTRLEDNRTYMSFEFNGHMSGMIPAWINNLIQKKWPLRFIQGLRKACNSI